MDLELNAEKTTNMFAFCRQNAEQNQNLKIAIKFFENVASSNTSERHWQIKITFTKKLRAD
jgi:hypothetical protein